MVEFTPFREGERTISFDVTNLGSKLSKISDGCNWDAVDQSRTRAKAADAPLRSRLMQYVHACEDQDIAKWCWSDPNDALFNHDTGWSATKEGALQDAMQSARWGLAFKNE
jgi:hypothetical protein